MSSTRAASAASSRRAKQKLVQLLFGPQYSGKGREAHKRLDHASYSFADLKQAFLQRVHDIHPDKHVHKKSDISSSNAADLSRTNNDASPPSSSPGHDEFIRLQEAWSEYEKMAKMMTRVGSGSSDADFTLFGVGCSFSDSPDEQRMRSEIMDQAGRGWLTAGILSERTTTTEDDGSGSNLNNTRLVDDDLFVVQSDEASKDTSVSKDRNDDTSRPKKLLVDIPKYLQKRGQR